MKKPLLPPATALTGDERVRVGQHDEARLATAQQFKDFVGANAAVQAEATARAAAISKVANDITSEASARSAADTRLTADLASETTARTAADTALGNRTAALESLVPRRAIITYAGADFTWTYPAPFPAGTVPIIAALAVGPTTGSQANTLFNVQLVGDPTNASCRIRVNNVPNSTISLLGLTAITLFQQAPSGVKVHLFAFLP